MKSALDFYDVRAPVPSNSSTASLSSVDLSSSTLAANNNEDEDEEESPFVASFLGLGDEGAEGSCRLTSLSGHLLLQRNLCTLESLCIRELMQVLCIIDCTDGEPTASASASASASSGLISGSSSSNSGGGKRSSKNNAAQTQCLFETLTGVSGSSSSNRESPSRRLLHQSIEAHPISLSHPLLHGSQSLSTPEAAAARAFTSLVVMRLCQRRYLSSAFALAWAAFLQRFVAVLVDQAARFDDILSQLAPATSTRTRIVDDAGDVDDSGNIRSDSIHHLVKLLLHSSLLAPTAPEHLLLRTLLSATLGAQSNAQEGVGDDTFTAESDGKNETEAERAAQLCAASIENVRRLALAALPVSLGDCVSSSNANADTMSEPVTKKLYLLTLSYHLQLTLILLDMAATGKICDLAKAHHKDGVSISGSGSVRSASVCSNSRDSEDDDAQREAGDSRDFEDGEQEGDVLEQEILQGICRVLKRVAVPEKAIHGVSLSPVPVLAWTIRAGLTFSLTGGTFARFDFINVLLRNPLMLDRSRENGEAGDGSVDKESHTALVTIPWQKISQHRVLALLRSDPGYEHFQALSRADAVAVLLDYQSSVGQTTNAKAISGTFLVRPHDRHPDLLFLSFLSAAPSTNSASGSTNAKIDSGSVTHAIIRRIALDQNDSFLSSSRQRDDTSTTQSANSPMRFEYKCGRVGPFYSLNEMLQAISKVIVMPSTNNESASINASKKSGGLTLTSPVPLPPFSRLTLPSYKGSGPVSAAAALFHLASSDPNAKAWDEAARVGLGALSLTGGVASSVLGEVAFNEDSTNLSEMSLDPWQEVKKGGREVLVHGVVCLLTCEALLRETRSVVPPLGLNSKNDGAAILSSLAQAISSSLSPLLAPLPDSALAFHPHLSPSGVLTAERVAGHLLDSCSVQTVKLPGKGSGLGATEYKAECLDPSEVIAWLVEREERLQSWLRDANEFAVEKALSGNGMSAKFDGGSDSSSSGAGAGAGAGASGKSLSRSLQAVLMLKRAVLESHALSSTGVVDSANTNIFLLGVGVSQNTSAAPSAQGQGGPSSANPGNFSIEDWAISYASWLQEARVFYAAIKPPDLAFQAATTFYRYRDPWEVRCVAEGKNSGVGVESTEPTPGERFRLGRYFYYRPNIGYAIANSTAKSNSADGGRLWAAGLGSSLAQDGLRELWTSLECDAFLTDIIANRALPSAFVDRGHSSSAGTSAKASNVVLTPCPAPMAKESPLQQSLQLHLYRNCLFSRVGTPQRFFGSLKATLLGIKEVASVGGALGSASLLHFAPPSTMEIFIVVGLGRGGNVGLGRTTGALAAQSISKKESGGGVVGGNVTSSFNATFHQAFGVGNGGGSSGIGGSGGSNSNSGIGSLGRTPYDGTYTGQPHRAELHKPQASKKGGLGGGGGVEYRVKEKVLLRFPLPEGVCKVALNSTASTGCGASSSNGSVSGGGISASSRGRGYRCRAEEESWRGTLHAPPDTLHLTLYEKTFLSENKLGELHLPLDSLHHDLLCDEWHPLLNDKRGGGAWLVRLQLSLTFPLTCVEPPPTLVKRNAGTGADGTGASKAVLGKSVSGRGGLSLWSAGVDSVL